MPRNDNPGSEETYISLDLEMTSGRPENQEVIEIAAIKFRGEHVLGTWTRLIRPAMPLPYNVQVLTGIRPEELNRSPMLAEVADQFRSFVGALPIVAHTVSSDVGCLARQGVVLGNQQIDTFELATVLLPRMTSYSLASLVEHYRIPFPRQHRAAADALATKQLFLRLLDEARELDPTVLQELGRLVAPFDWPLKAIVRRLSAEQRQTDRGGFGASIRQQLLAKSASGDLPIDVLLLSPPAEPPLVPISDVALDSDSLAAVLVPDGPISQTLPGYEARPAQEQLLRSVAKAMAEHQRLVVEAGDGIGRALAYLIPAAASAVADGRPNVIATHSLTLREQIESCDLPAVRAAIALLAGGPAAETLRFARVQPRQSYLCLRRWTALRRRRDLSLAQALTLAKTLVWLPTTTTGDVAEINLSDAERAIWRGVAAGDQLGGDGCDESVCEFARSGLCFVARVRQAAARAHIILTSQEVAIADLASRDPLLPSYPRLIVDEAHHLEDAATIALGVGISLPDVLARFDELVGAEGLAGEIAASGARGAEHESLTRSATALTEATAGARLATTELFAALVAHLQEASRENLGYEQRARVTRAGRGRPTWIQAREFWANLDGRLDVLLAALGSCSESQRAGRERRTREVPSTLAEIRRAELFFGRLREIGDQLIAGDGLGLACWVSLSAEGVPGLHAAPVSVADRLRHDLFAPRECVILTSNTLAVAGSLAFFRGRVGLTDDAAEEAGDRDDSIHLGASAGGEMKARLQPTIERIIASPLDLSGTRLWLPSDLPDTDTPARANRVRSLLVDLALAAGGRTLVLFTAHTQLRQAYSAISKPLADRGVLVLGQGVDGSTRRHLVQTFRTNPRAVLLAAGNYWETLEAPGEALAVLVIARLPFAPPGDPIIAARCDGLRDPLGEYTLPLAILRFRQGLARLLRGRRGAATRGVVIVLDRRLETKSYGAEFRRSLPIISPGDWRSAPVAELPGIAVRWLAGENDG